MLRHKRRCKKTQNTFGCNERNPAKVAFFCGIGGMLYPVLMGAACDWVGLGGAFGLLAATAAAGAVLCVLLRTSKRKTGASAP